MRQACCTNSRPPVKMDKENLSSSPIPRLSHVIQFNMPKLESGHGRLRRLTGPARRADRPTLAPEKLVHEPNLFPARAVLSRRPAYRRPDQFPPRHRSRRRKWIVRTRTAHEPDLADDGAAPGALSRRPDQHFQPEPGDAPQP